MSFHIFCHASFRPTSFSRLIQNLSLEFINMKNFAEGEYSSYEINTRVYRVARTPAKTQKKNDEFSKRLGLKDGDYKGKAYHRVGFKVNKEVSLVALEFFGPSEKDAASYTTGVAVSRLEESWSWLICLLTCSLKPMYRVVDLQPHHDENVKGVKGENFVVRFPQPVVVTPDMWTDIKFYLEGPLTKFQEFEASQNTVFVDGLGSYTFDFLRGSSQLAAVHFIV